MLGHQIADGQRVHRLGELRRERHNAPQLVSRGSDTALVLPQQHQTEAKDDRHGQDSERRQDRRRERDRAWQQLSHEGEDHARQPRHCDEPPKRSRVDVGHRDDDREDGREGEDRDEARLEDTGGRDEEQDPERDPSDEHREVVALESPPGDRQPCRVARDQRCIQRDRPLRKRDEDDDQERREEIGGRQQPANEHPELPYGGGIVDTANGRQGRVGARMAPRPRALRIGRLTDEFSGRGWLAWLRGHAGRRPPTDRRGDRRRSGSGRARGRWS